MRCLLGALGLLLLVPAGTAELTITPFAVHDPTGPTTTSLFMHLGAGQDAPMNTQRPQTGGWNNLPQAGVAQVEACTPTTGAGDPLLHHPTATWHAWSTAGPVEYGYLENGSPRVVQTARALGADIQVDPGEPVTLHWNVKAGAPGSDRTGAGLVAPQARLRATLRSGEHVGLGEPGFDDGRLLAQGTSDVATLARGLTTGATYASVGGQDVYGFTVGLHLQNATLPRTGGYAMRIDLYLDTPVCPDPDKGELMPSGFEPYQDAAHLSHLDLVNSDPLRIANATLETDGSSHVFTLAATSPWGNYDVDAPNVTLDIEGPLHVAANLTSSVWRTQEFGHFADPYRGIWVWDPGQGPAAAGTYTATFTVPNLQHSANATATLTFTIGRQATPGPGAGWVPLLLGAVGATVRRRRA